MNPTLRKYLLRTDGAWLSVIAAPMMLSDLAAALAGWGPLAGVLAGAPDSAIGFVEAHGLALILGVTMLFAQPTRGAHGIGAAVHLLLGSANLVFWQLFVTTAELTAGYVTTSLHWLFFVLQLVAACASSPSLLGTTSQPHAPRERSNAG